MQEVRVTATGKLTADPEVVDVNGKSKVELVVATNPQMFKDGEFKDLPAVFTTVEFWGGLATAVGAKFSRGSLVVVTGVMRAKEYENREGVKKRFQYLRGEEIAEHVANRAATPRADDQQSAPGGWQGASNGPEWGGYSGGPVNGPYSADSGGSGPYAVGNSSNPYADGRQWGQR